MQLLIETQAIQLQLHEEAGGAMIAKGEYARGGVATANNRLYKTPLWKREVGRLKEDMRAGRVFGELDHPGDGKTKLARVSHILQDLTVEGDGAVVGVSKVVKTPNGKTLTAITEGGGQVGVSSRGTGSVTAKNGIEEVNDDFRLITFDFVADPAHRKAYPDMYAESKQVALADLNDSVITTEMMKKEFPGLYEEFSRILGLREDKTTDISDEDIRRASDLLRSEFATLQEKQKDVITVLVKKLVAEQREDVERAVESRLRSDPRIVGASAVVEKIVKLVTPFGMGKAQKDLVDAREAKIAELEAAEEKRTSELKSADLAMKDMAKSGKDAIMALAVERALAGIPGDMRGSAMMSIGDMTKLSERFESLDSLNKALEEALKPIVENLEEQKAKGKEREQKVVSEEMQGLAKRLDEVTSDFEKLQKVRDESLARVQEELEKTRAELEKTREELEEASDESEEHDTKVAELEEKVKKLQEDKRKSDLKLGILAMVDKRRDAADLWPLVKDASTLDEAVQIIRDYRPGTKKAVSLHETKEQVAAALSGGMQQPARPLPERVAPATVGGELMLHGVAVDELLRR